MSLAPSSLKRVLETNSTSADYQLAADVLLKPLDSASIKRVPVDGSLAAIVTFISTDADGDGGLCTIYGEYQMMGADGTKTGEVMRFPFGVATITAGSNAGATGGVAIASTEFIIDTISWAANAFLTAAENALNEGTSGAYSPANNTQACLFLPCLARCSALLFDFKTDGAGTDPVSLNALISQHPV
jgi:hypothetical protein